MRKSGLLLLAICAVMGVLAGCSSGNEQETSTSQEIQTSVGTEAESESSSSVLEEAISESGDSEEVDIEGEEGKTLVVYFSATGNTERVAEMIAEATGGDLFKLEPVDPYTDEDLDYNDDNSRTSREYADESLRNVELVAATVEDFSAYKNIFVGYPLWWSEAAWPVNSFVESNDFTGKTVIPFCTSGGSGLGRSGEMLAEMAGSGEWLEGMRFGASVSKEDVVAWVESIGL